MLEKEFEALETIKNISLSHIDYEEDEDFEGNRVFDAVEVNDGSVEDNYPEQIDILEQTLTELKAIKNAVEICKKANEQKYVYIKESYGIIKEKFLNDLDYEILNNRLYANSRGIYYDYPLKDYGAWWALTKEELEKCGKQ